MRQFKEHFERINNDYYYSGRYYEYEGGESVCINVRRASVISCILTVLFLLLSGLTLAGTLTGSLVTVISYVVEIIAGYFAVRDCLVVIKEGNKLKETSVNKMIPSVMVCSVIFSAAALSGMVSSFVHIITVNIFSYAIAYCIVKFASLILGIFIFISYRSISVTLSKE